MSAVDFPCSSTDAGDNQYDFELDELADQPQSSDINFNAFDDHETLEQTVKAPNAFLQRIMAKKPGSKLQNQPEKHRVISSRFARKPLAPARVSTAPVQIRHEQPPPTIGRRGSIFEDFESQTSSEDEKPVHPTPENGAVEVSEHASSDSSFFSVKSEEEKVENGLEAEGTCLVEKEDNKVVVTTTRGGSLCGTTIKYVFYPNGTMDMQATFTPHTPDLRRTGLVCGIDSTLSRVAYYAHGPWENLADRLDGCPVGRYTTTVDDMLWPYIKPQSTGSREGLRELTLTNTEGRGIRIQTQGQVSFSALRYTDEDLMKTLHTWELTARPYIVLHLDAYLRGTGNGSCGANTGTIPTYWVPQKKQSYTLRISPVK